jgi:hypothetical protein
MDRSIVAFIEGIVTLAVFAAIGLTGFSVWSRSRIRNQPPLDGLLDAVREENAQLHADLSARLAELEERVDFTERRLLPERSQGQSPTARIPTPV